MQDATETFLHYLYYDKIDPRTSAQHVVAVLHVAHYYGAGRLVALCEAFLAKELKRSDKDDEGEFAGLHEISLMLLQSGQIQLGPGTHSSSGAKAPVLASAFVGNSPQAVSSHCLELAALENFHLSRSCVNLLHSSLEVGMA